MASSTGFGPIPVHQKTHQRYQFHIVVLLKMGQSPKTSSNNQEKIENPSIRIFYRLYAHFLYMYSIRCWFRPSTDFDSF